MNGRTPSADSPDLAEIPQLIQSMLTQLGNMETGVSSTDHAVQLMSMKLDDLINRLDRTQFMEQHSMSRTGHEASIPFLFHFPVLAPLLGLASVGTTVSADKLGHCDPRQKAAVRAARQRKKQNPSKKTPARKK